MEAVIQSTAPAKPTLRVAAFCGSLRKDSWHRGLIRAAEELCEESIPGLHIDHVDISGLPREMLQLGEASGLVGGWRANPVGEDSRKELSLAQFRLVSYIVDDVLLEVYY